MSTATNVHLGVQEYYGQVLQQTSDLATNACCTTEKLPLHIRQVLAEVEPEIKKRFYGCGSPIPHAIEGCRVLDLGCGTGRDVYVCSKLVGEGGHVIGLDMTEDQLDVGRKYINAQAERFGYAKPNVTFVQGYMEDLAAAGIEDESIDLVISNCVINLSPQKDQVFREIFRVLKPGGELYFADVFSDRRLPKALMEDRMLWGECLSGALYIEDFRRLLQTNGINDYRTVSRRKISIDNPEVEQKVGFAGFHSMTVRAFKLNTLEDRCEDYGQVACYNGEAAHLPHCFPLDDHHEFETGRPMLVCGNTASMLTETRFNKYFHVEGDRSRHFGLFPCGLGAATSAKDGDSSPCC